MAYDNPTSVTYTLENVTISTTGVKLHLVGPAGKKGRVKDIGFVTTTATTGAVTELRVGDVADPDKYAALSVPIQAVNAVTVNAALHTSSHNLIPASTYFEMSSDGGSTAGAGTVILTIDWF
jgi:hypothetical protein